MCPTMLKLDLFNFFYQSRRLVMQHSGLYWMVKRSNNGLKSFNSKLKIHCRENFFKSCILRLNLQEKHTKILNESKLINNLTNKIITYYFLVFIYQTIFSQVCYLFK